MQLRRPWSARPVLSLLLALALATPVSLAAAPEPAARVRVTARLANVRVEPSREARSVQLRAG